MTHAPEELGWLGGELRHRRSGLSIHADATERELWRFESLAESSAQRIVDWGNHGLAGFEAWGRDADGVWLLRAPGAPTLHQLWSSSEGWGWQRAVEVALSIARVLAFCEERSLFPGPIQPGNVVVPASDKAMLRAAPLVASELGPLGTSWEDHEASPYWMAPEQAAGEAWDAAANRYVFGLLLYRILSGEHPVRGRGLRLGLAQLAERGPTPFSEQCARALPLGLQGFVLSLLAPERAQRPASARAMVARLSEWAHSDSVASTPAPVEPAVAPASEKHSVRSADDRAARKPSRNERRERAVEVRRTRMSWSGASWARGLSMVAPLAGFLLLVVLLVRPEAKSHPRRVEPRRPLSGPGLTSEDCESCHVRQTAEWRRSVMAHSVKSPMFLALEVLIEEQVGKSRSCAHGAGVMRKRERGRDCRDPATGLSLTGTAGELWCVNCHAPVENLAARMPSWDGVASRSQSRLPLSSLLPRATLEGISCAFCHQVHGPVGPGGRASNAYIGNAFWTSPQSGARFAARPEDQVGRFGIANSGYRLDPDVLLARAGLAEPRPLRAGAHLSPPEDARVYLESSEFCGACHDVRLFGSDVLGAQKGEHFKRLRNAYSEWRDWARERTRRGASVYSCQDCHMSLFPGICLPGAARDEAGGCPEGTHLQAVAPGTYPEPVETEAGEVAPVRPHYFSGVDLPLSPAFPDELVDEASVDRFGIPLGARARRDLLLARAVRMDLEEPLVRARSLEIPLTFENVAAGHRIPAGFSQERELWLHLEVRDARGKLVYEVGRVDRPDEDLHDKRFLRTNTEEHLFDAEGRPLGLFGADVADGPDVPAWTPNPALGGTQFRGRGLVNFQNGFLRCVVCIGSIDREGRCQPLPGQEQARADRYADGDYDLDSGRCTSNLSGHNALFETYFPVGALDATRGVLKAPDAIIDTRSLPPEVPIHYTYDVPLGNGTPPYRVEARLMFRAFPPFLLRAFIDYERRRARRGLRPEGPLVDERVFDRLELVEIAHQVRESG